MALPLGKLSIIIGAGLIGSVLAREGQMPSVSDLISGTIKIFNPFGRDKRTTSNPKPHDGSLLAEVNNLRQVLQLLSSSRPVTIVTSTNSGSRKYGTIIIVVVLGYGYVWWKGWKLPDLMFATKRSLSDATNAVAKQLENVYSSLAATKRHLSSRIDRVDCNLDECAEVAASTKEEVSALKENAEVIALDVRSVHHAVYTLETKLNRIEGKQDDTNLGVAKLLRTAMAIENQASMECIQPNPSSSPRPALELPQRSVKEGEVAQPLENAISAPSFKVLQGDSEAVESGNTPRALNEVISAEDGNSNSHGFVRTFSSISAFFSRN